MKFILIVLLIIGIFILFYQYQYVGRKKLQKNKTYDFLGSKQNYFVRGTGMPIILLHGSMISNPWNGFEIELAKNYMVYLPELPGFGSSDGVSGKIHNTKFFSEALCAFIQYKHLEKVPIIAFSLGAVVAIRSANLGCLGGKMLLVGTPGKVESEMLKKSTIIPRFIRRFLASTKLGREKILIPVLWDIIGVKGDVKTSTLPELLKTTDVRSLVDLDVYREIELDLPNLLKELKNKITFIYGEKDGVRKTTTEFIKNPIIISNADHNVFTSQPKATLDIIRHSIQ
jgi:pimeloyl-ACP methyl ester carboxylesterase